MDWKAIAQARNLDIPEEAIVRIAPSLDTLEAAFRPLLQRIPDTVEPAITLSESAVTGE
jgi:hypothetical protein